MMIYWHNIFWQPILQTVVLSAWFAVVGCYLLPDVVDWIRAAMPGWRGRWRSW